MSTLFHTEVYRGVLHAYLFVPCSIPSSASSVLCHTAAVYVLRDSALPAGACQQNQGKSSCCDASPEIIFYILLP